MDAEIGRFMKPEVVMQRQGFSRAETFAQCRIPWRRSDRPAYEGRLHQQRLDLLSRRVWRDLITNGIDCGLHRLSVKCASNPCRPGRDDGAWRGTKAIARSQPCHQIYRTGKLRPSDRTRVDFRLHRAVLQCGPTSSDNRIRQPGSARTKAEVSLTGCP